MRYSRWDGTQDVPDLEANDLLAALADDLMDHGDLRAAMRSLMRRGLGGATPMQGLRDLLRTLREERKQQLEQYNLSGVMDGIKEHLEEVLRLERDALDAMRGSATDRASENGPDTPEESSSGSSESGDNAPGSSGSRSGGVPPGGDKSEPSFASSLMQGIAERNADFLDQLPQDPAGKVKELQDYEFVSPEAQAKFEQLLEQLREAMTQTFFKDVEKMIGDMSEGDIQRMKDMIQDLNDMLVKHIGGDEDPGFDEFMRNYGDMFGPNPPASIDELVAQMQHQMAAMQSLMMSMPTSQFEQLQSLLKDRLGDADLDQGLRSLAQKLDFLDPNKGQRYRFQGDESLDLNAAMQLMEQMHDMEKLEHQLARAQRDGELDHVDIDQLEALLGEEAKEALEKMREFAEILEKAGYISRDGNQFGLTPRGMKRIGQSALGEIYRAIKRHSLGNHQLPEEGRFGERLDDTKAYEFGDPFHLHMSRTLQNALRRNGLGTPVALQSEDFEVYRHEQATRTSTVLLVDLSWSMELRGAFPSAKKVALALNNLITSAFPRDTFHVVGFSAYARELKAHEVPFLSTDEYVLGTNMHHALLTAEKLLEREPSATKQVLMITDGEPTAHIENGNAQFAYPPTPRTIRETLRAVRRCTSKRITINTFMLDESYYLRAFMDEVSKINGGRVFYASPERLGEYVLVDYVQNKRKIVGRH